MMNRTFLKSLKKLGFTLTLALLFCSKSFGQIISFKQVSNHAPSPKQIPAFKDFKEGQSILIDVDGDLDLDVIFSAVAYIGGPSGSGSSKSDSAVTELYLNDGRANFSLVVNTPFEGVENGMISHADVDGDLDEDVFITGTNNSGQEIANLYLNDGLGNFTLKQATNFDGVEYGDAKFADVDNDNDQDLLIVGRNGSRNIVANLYLNDSLGNFTLSSNSLITGTIQSRIAFGDLDNDNDIDVIVSGDKSFFQEETKLYLNNGSGQFSNVANHPFIDISGGDITIEDVDSDGDQDVIIAGYNFANSSNAQLYKNNGSGSFSRVLNTPFKEIRSGSLVFSDIDNDNDKDLFIWGTDRSNNPVYEYYTNNALGNYTIDTNVSLISLSNGHLSIGDLDGDSLEDAVTIGLGNGNASNGQRTYYYLNNGQGSLDLVSGSPFNVTTEFGTKTSTIISADLENDGDLDLIIYGQHNSKSFDEIYLNDGQGTFTLSQNQQWLSTVGEIAVADVDNDNDQDVLATGKKFTTGTEMYINNGQNSFSAVTNSITNIYTGDIKFADLDNDNDLDFILLEDNGTNQGRTELYLNNGSGSFSKTGSFVFGPYAYSKVGFNDVDNDGDLDIVIVGRKNSNDMTEIYLNGGSANFTLSTTSSNLPTNSRADFKFVDFDNDGDSDLIFYYNTYNSRFLEFYSNDGNGNYSIFTTPSVFNAFSIYSIEADDVDKDGDQDLYISGIENSSGQIVTQLFLQDSGAVFTPFTAFQFPEIRCSEGSIELFDFDNDGDKDIAISGNDYVNKTSTLLFENNSCFDSFDTINVNACYSYTWNLNGTTYFNSGVFSDTTITEVGCDSVVTLNLAIRQFDEIYDTIAACDSFQWIRNNTFYSASGVYRDTAKYSNSCDTIYILDLSIYYTDYDTSIKSSCEQFIWSANNLTYTQTGFYMDTLTNSNGCDSIVSLDLTILKTTFDTIPQVACNSYYWPNTLMSYNQSGIYNDTTINAVGCDSIISLNLTIHPVYRDTIQHAACDSFQWTQTSANYSASGFYSDTLKSIFNCDSILILDLTIYPSYSDSSDVNVCDSYVWNANNTLLTNTGIYKDTLSSQYGCDSIVILNLTINQSSIDTTDATSCDSYLWLRNNVSYFVSGFYRDTIATSNGCDSIQILNLTINPTVRDTVSVIACDSFVWRNNTFFSNGFYNDTLQTQLSCDSISTLNLSFTTNDKTVTVVGDSLYSNNSNASSYQWMTCQPNGTFIPLQGENNQGFKADSTADYAVEVIQGNCSDTSICYSIVIVGLDKKNNHSQLDWKIYPNPISHHFTLEVDANLIGTNCQIFDLSGKVVSEVKVQDLLNRFEINLPSGVYFVKVDKAFKKLVVAD